MFIHNNSIEKKNRALLLEAQTVILFWFDCNLILHMQVSPIWWRILVHAIYNFGLINELLLVRIWFSCHVIDKLFNWFFSIYVSILLIYWIRHLHAWTFAPSSGLTPRCLAQNFKHVAAILQVFRVIWIFSGSRFKS